MTPADLTDAAFDASAGQLVTDQHGRALDLLYGFVSRAPGISAARELDLATAKGLALDVYRDFLSDEAGFRTSTSRAYQVQVEAERAVPKPRTAPPYQPAPVPIPVPPPAVEPAAAPTSRGQVIAILVAAAAVGVIVIVVVAIWLVLARG
jgi:hypothetical protein